MAGDTVPPATTPATPPPPPATDTGAGGGGALPPGVTPEMVAAGQQIFTGAGGCMACHGPDATGTPLAPNLTDNEWINISGRNYDEIVNLIKTGVPTPKQAPAPMPPRGGSNITDDQVNQVAAYVVSLGG
jgi:mono/diheme cytochrome c family protein